MYTQCSKCETVFRLSADVLRAAGGQVRCGRCGEVFNALARLAEDPGAFPVGESPLEMEARANDILESAVPVPAPDEDAVDTGELDSNDIEFARLQVVEKFVEDAPPAPTPAPTPAPAAELPNAKAAPPAPKLAPNDGSMEFTLPPGELDRVFIERSKPSGQMPSPADTSAGLGISEDARRDMLSGIAEPAIAEFPEAPRRPASFNLWLGAALLLSLLLCAQLLNGNREWFATHAPFRGPLQGLYAALGIAVAAPANLSAYQLRQWGVTGDPSATGNLRVRASILNTAAQLQPYPLLRVTLANRFGARIGTRDFEPSEYIGKPIVRMLAPGERADATLDIVDPGKDAEGFEIDVCLRGADRKVTCAGDAATQAKQPHDGN